MSYASYPHPPHLRLEAEESALHTPSLSPNLGIGAGPVVDDSPVSYRRSPSIRSKQNNINNDLPMMANNEPEESKYRIAFGSCNDQDVQNNLWPVIESRKPAAFIWGGDAIYADFHTATDWSTFPPTSELQCATPDRLKALYRKQLAVPGYRRLLDQNITVFGTFDDHDYGCNNADRTYEFKYESSLEYVKFLGEPKESAMSRRARAGHGVYGVKLFDFDRPSGSSSSYEVPEWAAGIDPDALAADSTSAGYAWNNSNKTVAVFVLDVRTHKTPWKTGTAAYRPDPEGDFLGVRQWQWFESAIRNSQASVNVVVNGLQVHANRFPDGNVAEAWGKYPRAQQRLFDALLQDGVQAPVLISGDVHMTQLMRKDCQRTGGSNPNGSKVRPLIEMTTSGMTHSWGTLTNAPVEEPDWQPTWKLRYESLVARNLLHMLHYICPWTDLMVSSPLSPLLSSAQESSNDAELYENGGGDETSQGLQFSLEKNFGELEFDWEERTVAMRAFGENPDASPLLMAKASMDQLSGNTYTPGSSLTGEDFLRENRTRHPTIQGEWTCINHRGQDNMLSHVAGHVMAGVTLTVIVPIPFLLPSILMFFLIRRATRNGTFSRSSPLKTVA